MKALLIPVDGEPSEFDWTGASQLSKAIGVEYIDLATCRQAGAQFAVGDSSLLDGSALNTQATDIAAACGYRGCLHGNVVLIGVTAWGDECDYPQQFTPERSGAAS